MKPGDRDRDELLALYANDALDEQQRSEVEAELARSPAAKRELEDIRALLGQVEQTAPEPASEPDWQAMSASIRQACAEQQGQTSLLRKLLAPKYAIGVFVAAAAAVVLIVALRDGARTPDRVATIDAGVVEEVAEAFEIEIDELRSPEIEELSGEELADLEESLAELDPLGGDDDDDEPDETLDVFGEPEYEWVDDLSEEELTRVADYLAAQAG